MRKPIRVLHYGMSSNVGGIESFIMNVYRNIDKRKFQFDFLAFENPIAYDDEIKELGGRIYYLTSRRENFIENHKQLVAFFKEHLEYKNVHVHINTCSYIKPIIMASNYGNRNIIVHSHNEWKGSNLRTKLMHNLNKSKVVKRASHLIACSDVAGNYMFKTNNSVSNSNFKIIKNAIDSQQYRYDSKIRKEMRESLALEGKFVIGHVGRFSYQKNHDFILDVFKRIHQQDSNSILLLVGNGELEEKIKDKINKLKLEKSVQMLGIRNNIPQLLQAMDVFLFPSHYEGLPFTLIEAQAAGLPCVISDEISEEVCLTKCIEFKSLNESAKEWAKFILKYKNNNGRIDTLQEIIESGFEINSQIEELEKIYV